MKPSCVIYCRVSSKEQEDSGFSLDAQKKLLEEYASAKGFEVMKLFRISESASGKQVRSIFNDMLAYVASDNIQNILCEKIDRLTRNLKDAATVNDWVHEYPDRAVHFVKENFIVSKHTRAHENLVWDMKVAIARFYTNNLSEEVHKGLNEKASQGMYPGSFKYGYLSVGEKGRKHFIRDPNTFCAVKKLLEDYASGQYSMKHLALMAWSSGIRTRYGKKLYKSQIERLLVDTFNYGWFTWKGKLIKGQHEPLISKAAYDRIQEVRIRKKAPSYGRRDFLFSKMITCGECGGSITSEIQRGHVYCHCNGYKDCKQKKYIRQEVIEAEIMKILEVFTKLNQRNVEEICETVRSKHLDEVNYKESVIDSLTALRKAVQIKVDRLYDDKLSGVISEDFWRNKHKTLILEQDDLEVQLDRLKTQDVKYFELGLNILKLVTQAKDIYEKRSLSEKRMLLRHLFESISLKDGKLICKLQYLVRKLYERLSIDENSFEHGKAFINGMKNAFDLKMNVMLALEDSFRTIEWEKEYENPQKLMSEIHEIVIPNNA
jgi:site-specific DNA recombinase